MNIEIEFLELRQEIELLKKEVEKMKERMTEDIAKRPTIQHDDDRPWGDVACKGKAMFKHGELMTTEEIMKHFFKEKNEN